MEYAECWKYFVNRSWSWKCCLFKNRGWGYRDDPFILVFILSRVSLGEMPGEKMKIRLLAFFLSLPVGYCWLTLHFWFQILESSWNSRDGMAQTLPWEALTYRSLAHLSCVCRAQSISLCVLAFSLWSCLCHSLLHGVWWIFQLRSNLPSLFFKTGVSPLK